MNTTKLIATVTSTAALLALGALPATAGDGDVIRRGSCAGATDWKIKAGPQDGRIEVEAEIDSNRVGQTWRWRLVHDGSLTARGRSRTKAPSGSFEVRRVVVDLRGTDSLKFRAANPRTGEVCVARVRF